MDDRFENTTELLIRVDTFDRELGTIEKLAAHRDGILHRAFSVFVFDNDQRLLLQRRARGKYHSGGLWSNTCCSHPRAGESVLDAAHRRLPEEMGFDCPLREVYGFTYRAALDHGLVEHEYDHVLVGRYQHDPVPNPDEVEDWRWVRVDEVTAWLTERPDIFTAWFKPALEGLLARDLRRIRA